MASIIPPKKPRKPGMPKLSIPLRPSSSSDAHTQPFGRTSDNTTTTTRPSLRGGIGSLADVNTSTRTESTEEDDYYEGHLPYHSTASSIYPDTVPGPLTDQQALTNDLKRAIAGSHGSSSNSASRRSSERMVRSGSGGSSNSSAIPPSRLRHSSGDSTDAFSSAAQIPSSSKPEHSPLLQPQSSASSSSIPSNAHSPPAMTEAGSSASAADDQNEDDDPELILKDNLVTLARLGEGASGEVRKCRHTPTGMIMAVKVSKADAIQVYIYTSTPHLFLVSTTDRCSLAQPRPSSSNSPRAVLQPYLSFSLHCSLLWRIPLTRISLH